MKSQRDQVCDYLNRVKDEANLRQWIFKVGNDVPPDDAWADVEISQHLWTVTIRISDDFFNESSKHQREVLAHELTHVHYATVERLVEALRKTLGDSSYHMFERLWDIEVERAADSLAIPLSEALPLPKFRKGKR
jgi:hypothetical protein